MSEWLTCPNCGVLYKGEHKCSESPVKPITWHGTTYYAYGSIARPLEWLTIKSVITSVQHPALVRLSRGIDYSSEEPYFNILLSPQPLKDDEIKGLELVPFEWKPSSIFGPTWKVKAKEQYWGREHWEKVMLEPISGKLIEYKRGEYVIFEAPKDLVEDYIRRRILLDYEILEHSSKPKRVYINPAELTKLSKNPGSPVVFDAHKVPLLKPKSPLAFPRAPSREEQDIFWEHFSNAVFEMGKNPAQFREAFDNRMKLPYRSWEAFLTVYEKLLETIEAGKEVAIEFAIPLIATRISMPWRTDTAENERFDAITHLTSIRLYETIEDLIYSQAPPGLEAYGILGVTPEEVKKTVKKAWKEKNAWFRLIDKEWLEKFIGEKLD